MDLLLVSSDPKTVEFFRDLLQQDGHTLLVKSDIGSSLRASKDGQTVIIDCHLSDGTNLDCLEDIQSLNNDIIAIVITEEGDVKGRKEAYRRGAFFCLERPLDREEASRVLYNSLLLRHLKEELTKLENLTIEGLLRRRLGRHLERIKELPQVSLYETVMSEVEKALMRIALESTKGNKSEASKLLGMNRNTLRNKLKRYRMN